MKKSFSFFLFLAFTGNILLAQNTQVTDTGKVLEEVVLHYQAEKLTPVSFQNINSADLKEKSTGQEPSYLLIETPSVTNYSDAGSSQGYSYFRMRGIDQTRINITLDGVPMNEPEDQGAYFSNYPDIFNSVSQIQIQRGVGTTKNGVAAYGGSIQLFSPGLHDSTKTTFGVGYGSFNSLRAFGEYNSGIKKRKALYVRASEIYSDGYKYHSSNHSQSVFLSTGYFFDNSYWKLNFLAGQQRNQLAWIGVPDSLISIDRRINVDTNERDHFMQWLAQIKNNLTLNEYSSLETSVYNTFLVGNYDFNLNGFSGLPVTNELNNYAFRSNLAGIFSNYTYARKHFHFVTGIHGNTYNRQHTGSDNLTGQLYTNTGYKNEIGLFTKADYEYKKCTFFTDLQYRYSSFSYKGSVAINEMQWNFLNPKAGLSYEVRPDAIIYYSIGRTGREPTRNDMFGGNDNLLTDSTGKALIYIHNPEHVVDHELGIRKRSRNLIFSFNLYYMNFKNEIVLNGQLGKNGLALTDNVDKSIRTGAELNFSSRLNKHFKLANNSSFNYSHIEEQQVSFTPILTPPFISNQEVTYLLNRCSLSLTGRYQDQSYIDFANTSFVKGYFLLNCRITYTIKGLQVGIFINNITGTKYFNNGYVDAEGSKRFFVQSPANYCISLKYSF